MTGISYYMHTTYYLYCKWIEPTLIYQQHYTQLPLIVQVQSVLRRHPDFHHVHIKQQPSLLLWQLHILTSIVRKLARILYRRRYKFRYLTQVSRTLLDLSPQLPMDLSPQLPICTQLSFSSSKKPQQAFDFC